MGALPLALHPINWNMSTHRGACLRKIVFSAGIFNFEDFALLLQVTSLHTASNRRRGRNWRREGAWSAASPPSS